MTRAEMTEIFALLMIAYPNAEMFRAQTQQSLKEKLAPTITLWTACLREVDFWTAQKAVIRLCRACKFPPTIAEMLEAAQTVGQEVAQEIRCAYLQARSAVLLECGDPEEAYSTLPTRTRKVIDEMGGMEAFLHPGEGMFDMQGFMDTYERLLRANPVGLPGGARKELSGGGSV